MTEHPSEARADLQRYFGLNIDDMGRGFSAFHAGACIANLPAGSKLLSLYEPSAAWTVTDFKLHEIECFLARKDLALPWKRDFPMSDSDVEKFDAKAVSIEEYERIYKETEWRPEDGRQCI